MAKCLKCSKYGAWRLADGRVKCTNCGVARKPRKIWDLSRLPEATKSRLLECFVFGVPVYRLRFRIQVSAPAAERFYRLARAACAYAEDLREPLQGQLELDETTFGGHHPGKRGWGAAGKVIVFGILKRNGTVKVTPVSQRNHSNILGKVVAHTTPGSLYYTDEWQAYTSLSMRGKHIVIRKEKGRPKGRDHINGIEGFWSYAKHWLYPYRGVSRRYFHLYLGEVAFRFNHRNEDLVPILEKLMKSIEAHKIDSQIGTV
jgi:transposase